MTVEPQSVVDGCRDTKEEVKEAPLGCLFFKGQLCGKANCRCKTKGLLHGPYAWLVTYVRVTIREVSEKKGEYYWLYLGKNVTKAVERMKEKTILTTAQRETIKQKIMAYQEAYRKEETLQKKREQKIKV